MSVYNYIANLSPSLPLLVQSVALSLPLPDTMLQSCRQPGIGRVAPQLTRARRTCTPRERPTDSSRWRTIIGCQDTLHGIIFDGALPCLPPLLSSSRLGEIEKKKKIRGEGERVHLTEPRHRFEVTAINNPALWLLGSPLVEKRWRCAKTEIS